MISKSNLKIYITIIGSKFYLRKTFINFVKPTDIKTLMRHTDRNT